MTEPTIASHPATLPDFSAITPESIAATTDKALAEADALIAQAAATATQPTFDTTIWPIELAGAVLADVYGVTSFPGYSHPDAAVRDAGNAAEERMSKWRNALPFRDDLYVAVHAFAQSPEAANLTPEQQQLLKLWLTDFERAGQALPKAEREELAKIRQRLVELEVAFQRNINEYEDGIDLAQDELTGLSPEFVERLEPGTAPDTKRVSLDYPELYPFLEQSPLRARRKELFRKHWSRALDGNRPLLTEALQLRYRAAQILGRPTWAHVSTMSKMAGNPETIQAFYDDLVPRLIPARDRELATLRANFAKDGNPSPFEAWDYPYYDEQLRRTDYGVDASKVAEYLPLDACREGLFELTSAVFGITITQQTDVNAWHPDVTLYEIRDTATDEHLACFYFDLHPREGKFGHAAAFSLSIGHRTADGTYVRPVSAILANFTPPSGDRPGLLQHNELETFFHEFGHILHMSLTRANYQRQSGAELEIDFVEAPSQIMEHWTWEPSVLGKFARHYQTGEPIPPELIEQMLAARMVNVAIKNMVQVHYGTVDQAIHGTDPEPDLDAIQRASYHVGWPYPEGTFLLSGWGHPMGGYDAAYYGYLWAEVIGDDLFGRFTREGVTSPAVGMDYRRKILERNGSRPAAELVRDFLGRDPTPDAFLRLRHLDSAP
jgi:thimet oligopeptidase